MFEHGRSDGFFVKNKIFVLISIFVVVVLIAISWTSVSLARYFQVSNQNASASVAGFLTSVSCDEIWEYDGSIVISNNGSSQTFPFQVTNKDGTTPVRVVVEITSDNILPLSLNMYAAGELLGYTDLVGNTYTYEYDMGFENIDFYLEVSALDGEYDERLNGFENNIRMVVICEQIQTGGVS